MNLRSKDFCRSSLVRDPCPSRVWTVSLDPIRFFVFTTVTYPPENKAALCEFFIEGTCARGANCPFRHVRGERTIVCKHWLRHLCKKGDDCEFLHEYDMTKMPICYFFQKFGECNNKDCQYLHIDAESLKVRECPWYDRGFCKHGRCILC